VRNSWLPSADHKSDANGIANRLLPATTLVCRRLKWVHDVLIQVMNFMSFKFVFLSGGINVDNMTANGAVSHGQRQVRWELFGLIIHWICARSKIFVIRGERNYQKFEFRLRASGINVSSVRMS
jgi:hypothetical protein